MLKWLNINNKAAKEVYGKLPRSSRADGHTGQSDGGGVVGDTESELPVWKRPKSAKLRRAVEPGTGGDRGMENQNNVDS